MIRPQRSLRSPPHAIGRTAMLRRDHYPAGVPCWIDTPQPDPHAAAAFYAEIFGWDIDDRSPTSAGTYLVGQLQGRDVAAIAAAPEDASATWRTYISVDDAEATATAVRDAGGQVLGGPS